MEKQQKKQLTDQKVNKPRSFVSVDRKGQLSLSREIREILNLNPGDKVAIYATPSYQNQPAQARIINVDDLIDHRRAEKMFR